jgi:hypothetical protein
MIAVYKIELVAFIAVNEKRKANLIGMLERPSVNTVVRCIQATLREPDDVTSLESTSPDCLERAIPVKCLSCHL